MMAQRRWAAEILHFWFHALRPEQRFGRDDAVDAELRRRFGRDRSMLSRRPAREFLRDRLTAQAAILMFDQVPRNIFRDDPRAFADDRLARAICKGMLRKGWDRGLSKAGRQFVLLPLEHSEAIADQRQSIRRFAALGDAVTTHYARDHYRMVARFGRFPHRNKVLGRKSTPAERRAVEEGNAW